MASLTNAVWDFDGTLADTYSGIIQSVQQTLKEFEYSPISNSELYRFIKKNSVKEYFQQVALSTNNSNFDLLYQRFQQLDHDNQQNVQLFPEASQVLQYIENNNGHNYLWTHRDNYVYNILNDTHINVFFEEIITADSMFTRKPDPSALNYLINKYHLDCAQTVMIGDRLLDIRAGQNAGVKTIYYDVDQFHDGQIADYTVNTLKEINPLFEDIN